MSTGIPGEIYGLWEAYKLGGKLSWKELFQPAIKLCRDGFIVSGILFDALKKMEKDIRNDPGLSETFINKNNNQTHKQNHIIKMSKLAKTLEIISETNITEFYLGDLAKVIVEEINTNGNIKCSKVTSCFSVSKESDLKNPQNCFK